MNLIKSEVNKWRCSIFLNYDEYGLPDNYGLLSYVNQTSKRNMLIVMHFYT